MSKEEELYVLLHENDWGRKRKGGRGRVKRAKSLHEKRYFST